MVTATKTRRTRKVATTDIVPKGPCVGFEAVEHLVWVAREASKPPPDYVDLSAFDKALAADAAAEQHDLAERWTHDIEYDQRESVLRGARPVRREPSPPEHVPVAVATKSGAFYRVNSKGDMEAVPLDEKAEKHMAEILRLHDEQDGTPQTDPGPGAPAALPPAPRETDPAGPGSPQEDSALDKASDDGGKS